ncbi:MAG: thioredoxin family protein [Candidatus Aminicenantes bacterium]|nr:thioredoxin family protein [Candidatus Aminicenantes bacterium]
MKIEILGTGCPKCSRLAQNAREAVQNLGIDAEVVKVTDLNEISDYGVMNTPGLAVNGSVKSSGKVLSTEEIIKIIR